MYSENSRVLQSASIQSRPVTASIREASRAGRLLVPEYDVSDEIGCRERRRRQAEQLMAGLEPARMARLIGGHRVCHGQQRDRVRIFEPRQVEIPEEHDVGIQDAVALVGQRDGRGDLEELLDVPAAHRLGAQRPPELTPLALDDRAAAAAASRAERPMPESRCGARSPDGRTAAGRSREPADNASRTR